MRKVEIGIHWRDGITERMFQSFISRKGCCKILILFHFVLNLILPNRLEVLTKKRHFPFGAKYCAPGVVCSKGVAGSTVQQLTQVILAPIAVIEMRVKSFFSL